MDRVFSVDEISGRFWSPSTLRRSGEPSTMNRSESEWAFQCFLQEQASPKAKAAASNSSSTGGGVDDNDVMEIKGSRPGRHEEPSQKPINTNNVNVNGNNNKSAGGSNTAAKPPVLSAVTENIPVDSEEYQAFLKSRLNLACAAVALSRASYVISEESPTKSEGSQVSKQAEPGGSHGPSRGKDAGGHGNHPVSATQKKTGIPVRSTSGSSREQSDDDDEADGETATTENRDPADAKRVRRMLSNRESARRSRRRKQAHLTELETQVSQLRVENSSLLKRLSNVSQKFNEAAVDNRVLKADVETLRAKVKMAEETVKRLTGLNPTFHAMSEMSSLGTPPFDGSPSDASTDAAVPVRDDRRHHLYQATSNNTVSSSHDPRFNNSLADISSAADSVSPKGASADQICRTASLQRVASLEHLQKRIRGDLSPCGP
ncbi:hypothetical protein SAY87_023837 [Trapa incisa]|uniref:BZIP domain-containing protein n=1 Tax=Trapa incisa TaxID=236973 RepID=A0AAN7QSI7_9MYRT|nr:hypothetical protein SAY87_023837 [Trapa incisa]